MKRIDVSTPVVVFRADTYCTLGIIRSLGRLGVPVYGLDESRRAYGLRSRYCAGRFLWDCDGSPPEQLVDFLKQVAPKVGGKPILIPTFDSRSVFLEENGAALAGSYTFPRQPPGLVAQLCNKRSMYHLCKELNIPTAETLFPTDVGEVEAFLEQVRFPVVLKAIDRDRLVRRAGVNLVICQNRDELLDAFRRLDEPAHPNLMLQEYIPGEDDTIWMFNGYFDSESECRFGITGRKLRQSPIHTGMTSLGICLPNEIVDRNTRRLAKATGYRGIIDIGYRYDDRDGRYKVLDINPRVGATFRLFVDRNGLDVVRAQYLDLTGQHVPDTVPNWGRKWFVEDKDVISCWNYFREGKLHPVEWIRSYRGIEEAAHLACDDLAPAAVFLPAFAARVLGGAVRTAARAVGLWPAPKASAPPAGARP